MSIEKEKIELRQKVLSLRDSFPKEKRDKASHSIAQRLLTHIAPPKESVIAGYWPIDSEVDTRSLLYALQESGYRCALPVIEEKYANMVFRLFDGEEKLEKNPFYGFMQPAYSAEKITPDVIITPLLAFDNAGRRLGYGGGYYDRTIAALRANGSDISVIGLAYALQECDNVPYNEFDQVLDVVITEERVMDFRTEKTGSRKDNI